MMRLNIRASHFDFSAAPSIRGGGRQAACLTTLRDDGRADLSATPAQAPKTTRLVVFCAYLSR